MAETDKMTSNRSEGKESGSEKGLKWWVRFVIVPILGSGGIIGLVIAFYPPHQTETRIMPSASVQKKTSTLADSVTFYASSKNDEHEDKRLGVNYGETVILHWEVRGSRGKLFLRNIDADGNASDLTPIPDSGFKSIDATGTRDYFLEETDSSGNAFTLATVRVSAEVP